MAFKSDLQMAKEDNLKGCQETFSDFISECKDRDLCAGPCQVDDKSGTPISLQLFPYVKHCLHTCADKIKGLFNLLEVRDEQVSFSQEATINHYAIKTINICSFPEFSVQ